MIRKSVKEAHLSDGEMTAQHGEGQRHPVAGAGMDRRVAGRAARDLRERGV